MAPKGKAAAKNRAAPTKATRMAYWMTMSSDKDWKPWEQDEVKFTCGQLECSRDASGYTRPDYDAICVRVLFVVFCYSTSKQHIRRNVRYTNR